MTVSAVLAILTELGFASTEVVSNASEPFWHGWAPGPSRIKDATDEQLRNISTVIFAELGDLKELNRAALETLAQAAVKEGSTRSATDPVWKDLLKAGGLGLMFSAMTPYAVLAILTTLGFTSGGVAANSIAALIQGPSTVAGSSFAICQSIGATGLVPFAIPVVVGGAVAGIYFTYKRAIPTREDTD